MKRAVYPGSFDPITKGHIDLIERASRIVDELVVLVSVSSQKESTFTTEERLQLIQQSLPHLKNVRIESFMGLTTEYMKNNNIQVLVRGLRQVEDFEYEKSMAQYNSNLHPQSETILLYANPGLSFVSSRGVKEVARHVKSSADLSKFVSEPVVQALLQRMKVKGSK